MARNKSTGSPALDSWNGLNEILMDITEKECITLLKVEQKNLNRPTFVKRIHSRINRMRAERERAELMGKVS